MKSPPPTRLLMLPRPRGCAARGAAPAPSPLVACAKLRVTVRPELPPVTLRAARVESRRGGSSGYSCVLGRVGIGSFGGWGLGGSKMLASALPYPTTSMAVHAAARTGVQQWGTLSCGVWLPTAVRDGKGAAPNSLEPAAEHAPARAAAAAARARLCLLNQLQLHTGGG